MVKLLRRIALVVALAVGALLLAFVVVVTIGFRVDLSALLGPAERAAREAIAREVTLDGPLVLIPTWSPTLEVEGVQIGNPAGWATPDFARLELASVRVSVLPLLLGRAVVRELRAEGVSVRFERRSDGRVNWDLLSEMPPQETAPSEPAPEAEPLPAAERSIRAIALEELVFRDVTVAYRDDMTGDDIELAVDELEATVATHEPLWLEARGHIGAHPYEATIDGGPPVDLTDPDESWPLKLTLDVADSRFAWSTNVDVPLSAELRERRDSGVPLLPAGSELGDMAISIEAERLDALGALFGVDLPPWESVGVAASLAAQAGGSSDATLEVEVGSSRLEGSARLERTRERPRLDMELVAERVQLDDFALGDWRPLPAEPEADGEAAPAPEEARENEEAPEPGGSRSAALLSPEALRRLDAFLSVGASEVLAGKDQLGEGELNVRLENGRFESDAHLEIPGGKSDLHFVYEPTETERFAEMRARIKRFDYGVLARRLQPKTDLAGLFGLDLELRGEGPLGAPLFGNSHGHLDLVVFPREFHAGVIDLWSANLLAAVVPVVDPTEGSKLNCVIALFDLENGVMHERKLILDTSNMTVDGTATADFNAQTVAVTLKPEAKVPRMFTASTPVEVNGSFDDFGIGLGGGGLIGTTIRMATSPVHVPVRRLIGAFKKPLEQEACLGALEERVRGD